jgi:hypothetical protein
MSDITIERVLGWVEDVREEFQREEDQGILQCRLDKAQAALSGKDACERLKRSLEARYGMSQHLAVVNKDKRRA